MIHSLYHSKLNVLYKRYKQQMEQHLTLRSMNSAILTLSEGHIKYFNDRGKAIMHSVVGNIDARYQRACDTEIEQLYQDINQFRQVKT